VKGVVGKGIGTGIASSPPGISLELRRARPCPHPSLFRFGAGDGVIAALGESATNELRKLLDGTSLSGGGFSVALEPRSAATSFSPRASLRSELTLFGAGFVEGFGEESSTDCKAGPVDGRVSVGVDSGIDAVGIDPRSLREGGGSREAEEGDMKEDRLGFAPARSGGGGSACRSSPELLLL